jgi:hypothetical protein
VTAARLASQRLSHGCQSPFGGEDRIASTQRSCIQTQAPATHHSSTTLEGLLLRDNCCLADKRRIAQGLLAILSPQNPVLSPRKNGSVPDASGLRHSSYSWRSRHSGHPSTTHVSSQPPISPVRLAGPIPWRLPCQICLRQTVIHLNKCGIHTASGASGLSVAVSAQRVAPPGFNGFFQILIYVHSTGQGPRCTFTYPRCPAALGFVHRRSFDSSAKRPDLDADILFFISYLAGRVET